MENKEFDKLFREAFQEAEETPNPMIWEKIEMQLDCEKKIVPIAHKRKSWIPYAAAAAVIIGIGSYFTIQNTPIAEKDDISETIQIAAIEDKNAEIISLPSDEEVNQTISPAYTGDITVQLANNKTTQEEPIHEKANIETIDFSDTQLTLANETIDLSIANAPTYRQVTEIEDIKPLIEQEEEYETMLASTAHIEKENSNVITGLIHTITDNVNKKNKKEIQFYSDDEGFIGINIINSIAKNRNKKRK